MGRNKPFFILLLIFISTMSVSKAQVWVGTVPMYYNPSFAGNTGGSRASMFTIGETGTYRKRIWPFLTFDTFIPATSTGVGASVGYTKTFQGDRTDEAISGGLFIAPKIS